MKKGKGVKRSAHQIEKENEPRPLSEVVLSSEHGPLSKSGPSSQPGPSSEPEPSSEPGPPGKPESALTGSGHQPRRRSARLRNSPMETQDLNTDGKQVKISQIHQSCSHFHI